MGILRSPMGRVGGSSRRGTLASIGLVAALALGSWALFARADQDTSNATEMAAHDADAQARVSGFRYADTTDHVLFRVDTDPVAQPVAPSARPAGVPIRISRHAALASARHGMMSIELPDGTTYPVRYERSENAPGGTWTFIGRVDTTAGDLAAVITFGTDGVFGLLPTPDGGMLQITTRAGRAYLAPAAGIVPPGVDPARNPDFLLPPKPEPGSGPAAQASAPETTSGVAGAGRVLPARTTLGQASVETDSEVTIDVLAAYTTNLVALRGSANAAKAEFQNLVAVANQAHIDSGSRVRLQIAGFAEVDYPAGAANQDVLFAVTDGNLPDGTDLHALRDATAADLVAVIRPYAAGDPTCGIAWLPGQELMAYDLDDDSGYSVTAVEDCGPLVLAHEIGHNLGLMHDRDTVLEQYGGTLGYGAFPFSFGYRHVGPPPFVTVMAYEVGGLKRINRFSHPATDLCEGVPCGVADEADSVRSLNLTAGTIARFRDPPGTISILDARVLEGNDDERRMAFMIRTSTPAPAGGITFELEVTGGTATAGVDWKAATDQPVPTAIVAGHDTAAFYVDVLPDAKQEGDETVLVRLKNVQGISVHDAEAIGVVQDDDPRVRVGGTLVFPPNIAIPDAGDVWMEAVTHGIGIADTSHRIIQVEGPGHVFETMVPKGGNLELYVSLPAPFLVSRQRVVGILAAMEVDLPVRVGVPLSGRLRFPAGAGDPGELPLILWNPRGDGDGYYANYYSDGGFHGYSNAYETLVMTDVPLQLEVRNPPAPYVRQLVEVPPLRAPATRDVELRKVPSLTITHGVTDEGAKADGFRLVGLVAELSVPAPAGGVAFELAMGGSADAADYRLPVTAYAIPEGSTTVPITVAVVGDDDGEPDEVLELHVTGIEGAAWSPGPGTVRIVTDEPREVGNGACTGSTAWPAVKLCE